MSVDSALASGSSRRTELPGGAGLWLFLIVDLLLFGLYFLLFCYDYAADRSTFRLGQAALSQSLGFVNTTLLIASSWVVVLATRSIAINSRAAFYLWGAALLGGLFLGLKAIEYMTLLAEGYSLVESAFFTWYFMLTGYHALHVVLGIALLIVIAIRLRQQHCVSPQWLESVACYWHLVDVLWIGIFSFVYLLG